MSGRPLVSVLLPAYNGEPYVGEALASVLGQTYANLEVLVGDDGSTDSTAATVEGIAAGDARVRLIRRPRNVGAFENPALLLAEARGELVKFMLQDDLLAPECIERLAAPMIADPGITLATSKRGLIDATGRRLPDEPHTRPIVEADAVIDGIELGDFVLERLVNQIGEMTTVLFRNGLVDPATLWSLDGRVLRALGDLVLWLKLLARGRAFYAAEELSFFRIHGDQRSGRRSILLGGNSDWPFVIDGARALGFLASPRAERTAVMRALSSATATLAAVVHDDDAGGALETAYLALGRLIELAQAEAERPAGRIDRRLHSQDFTNRLTLPLDGSDPNARGGEPERLALHPVGLAAPAVDREAVRAAVRELREIAAAGIVGRCIAAVDPGRIDAAVPLFEAALAEGEDFELELVPAADPGELLRGGWLVVAPEGPGAAGWAERRGAAVRRYAATAAARRP